jgi:uncharacterized protein YjlB
MSATQDKDPMARPETSQSSQTITSCTDLDAAIAHYTEQLGYRLDMIMPADAPRVALLSGDGISLRLECADRESTRLAATREFSISRADTTDAWVGGRAGMQYRDLIPGRLGGSIIASHIRIPAGGPVPDYVHYHKVGFQMIFCKRGWAQVVYEDQGPPFAMHAGDCVLQPPTIRHRVLEASPGLEVIEVGCPAEHETWREHAFDLPTPRADPERRFGGQRFVHHIAARATWQRDADTGCAFRDTGIARATDGRASVRVLRFESAAGAPRPRPAPRIQCAEVLFLLVLDGRIDLASQSLGAHSLAAGDACVIPGGADYLLRASMPADVLEVVMPTMVRS